MATLHNIFISHSWSYSDAYEKLYAMLKERPYFSFQNFSVPKDDPVHCSTDSQLYQAIQNKIRLCHVILIMAGKYSTYSKWISKEIEIARAMNKPIVAIKPWGAQQISSVVRNAAKKEAGWNSKSIIEAIREVSLA